MVARTRLNVMLCVHYLSCWNKRQQLPGGAEKNYEIPWVSISEQVVGIRAREFQIRIRIVKHYTATTDGALELYRTWRAVRWQGSETFRNVTVLEGCNNSSFTCIEAFLALLIYPLSASALWRFDDDRIRWAVRLTLSKLTNTAHYVEIKCQLDATEVFIADLYCLLNMFRASLCPSSGAQKYYTVVAACGILCCGFFK